MSSIPNSAMPRAQSVPSSVVAGKNASNEQSAARSRTVSKGALTAGATVLGVAAGAVALGIGIAAASASLWAEPKKRQGASRRKQRKTAA